MNQILNRLGSEDSLYLRQHADNPVAWQPWDDEALALAREAGKPILLSIGYSACHWCHVMAHESFEDDATAQVMNELYINIKVDREERPDLDKIYQLSHQLLTGRGGGWPLTLWLDPVDQTPFFAGTYFPVQTRYGMPAFREVLVKARQWFDENPADVSNQGERLRDAIEAIQEPGAGKASQERDHRIVEDCAGQVLSRFDARQGGFGGAPKFPQAPLLELVADLATTDSPNASAIENCLDFTLERMACSGLRDHLDGGFFRYCVDDTWTIPHFEKMLYDNAQLLPLYAEAAARTGSERLLKTAEGIVAWLNEEMRQDNGAFSASIDADADGEEGGFHVWTDIEVQKILSTDEHAAFAPVYGLDGPPNFEGKAWHLVGEVESESDGAQLSKARRKLHAAREKRVHPTLDEKQLTSWNALTAAGLLRAGRALARPDWVSQAHVTLDFILDKQWDGACLRAVNYEGEPRFVGYLDDYAFTLSALVESLKTAWRRRDLDFALVLADSLLDRFEDKAHGGFFFSDRNQPMPVARSIAAQDDATPSAYGIAISALNSLAQLTGAHEFQASAERALARARGGIGSSPLAFASITRAIVSSERPIPQLVITGEDPGSAESLKQWAESHFPVNCYLIRTTGNEEPLPGILAEFCSDKPVTAWLCLGMKCLPPVHTPEALQELLAQQE